jgi:HD superfamily phosphodiesterase
MKNLNEYLIYTIGERYQDADKGHDIRHILNVFSFAEKVRSTYFDDKVSKDMLMTAVFYHDLACKDDRENHHIIFLKILSFDITSLVLSILGFNNSNDSGNTVFA